MYLSLQQRLYVTCIVLLICAFCLMGIGLRIGIEAIGLATIIMGLVASIAIGLPIAIVLVISSQRWCILSIIFIWFLIFLMNTWAGLLAILSTIIGFFAVSATLHDLYGLGQLQTGLQQILIMLGLLRGFQQITNGVTTVPPQSAGRKLSGPRPVMLIGSGAIFTLGASITQVNGPGFYRTGNWETASTLFDLSAQVANLHIDDLVTSDHLAVEVQLCTTFCIDLPEATRQGDRDQFTEEHGQYLRDIANNLPNWQDAAQQIIEQAMRSEIADHELDDCLATQRQKAIESAAKRYANDRLSAHHIRVLEILIKRLQPKAPVGQATAETWMALNRQNVEVGRAAAWRDALEILADAYQGAKAVGLPERELSWEIMRRVLETMAEKTSAVYWTLGADALDSLADMRRMAGLPPTTGHR